MALKNSYQFPVCFLSLISCLECPVVDLYPLFISSPKKQQLYACVITICFASPNILGGIRLYRELYQPVEICDTSHADMLHLNYFLNAYFSRLSVEIQ